MLTIPDRLARLGKEWLGSGDAAFVWARPDDPWVVKIGFDGDDGWPAWAAWCRANPGPHVPVIHAYHVIEHGGQRQGFVGVLERLYATEVARAWMADDRLLKRAPERLAGLVETEHPGVAAMLRSAAATFPLARWDLAPMNWMVRADQTLVLTDPMSRAAET